MRPHHYFIGGAAFIVAGAAVFAATCAAPTEEDSSDLSAAPAVTSCQAFAVSRCERMDACTGGTWIDRFFGSLAACEEHVGEACRLRASAPGVSMGSASIDACTAALAEASCAEFFAGVAACRPSPGTLALDAACTYPIQCESAFCEREPGASCGTCATRPMPPETTACGYCPSPGVCAFGHCAMPGGELPSGEFMPPPVGSPGLAEGLAPGADPRVAGLVRIASRFECEGGCRDGYTCLSLEVPSLSDPAQSTTRFGCAPVGSDPLACVHAGLVLDPTTGECELPGGTLPLARPSGTAQHAEGLEPAADARLGAVEIAVDAEHCDGACGAGYTCLSITIPSLSDPAQSTTRYGCAPSGTDPLASASLTARFAAPSRAPGPVEGLAELADPRFASIDLAPDPMHCEGGCAEGFACLRMRIPSITDPAQSSTGYGCAPMGSAATTASPIPNVLFAVAAPSGSPQPVEGLEPGADGRVAGAISIATGIDSCGGACGVGYTCLSITIPSLSDPAQTTTRFGCAPTGADPFTGTPTVAPAPSGTAQPVEGLEPPVDARLAGTIQIATDAMQCDGGRGCGEGFTCMRMEVPSLSSPSQTTTRYGCAPSSRTALACARTGLLFDPATGECVWPVVAAAGEACGASRPGVVCAEAGRCVRRQDGESVCVAASPVGGECFTDRTAGPGCMAPAFCAREGGAEVGTCTRPEPHACGE